MIIIDFNDYTQHKIAILISPMVYVAIIECFFVTYFCLFWYFGHNNEPLIDVKVWMKTKEALYLTDLTALLIDDKGGQDQAGLVTKRQIG